MAEVFCVDNGTIKQSFPLNAMFDVERILAIPDDLPDHRQMGISVGERVADFKG